MTGLVPIVAPRSRAMIEQAAERELREHQPNVLDECAPVNVLRLFDIISVAYGYRPAVETLSPEFEGQLSPRERKVILQPHVYDALEAGDGRARFSGAHEIGHVVLHGKEMHELATDRNRHQRIARRNEIPAYRDPEWQADTFAGALLMPRLAVRRAQGRGHIITPGLLQAMFGVSRRAAEVRYDILIQPQRRRCD